ncbi:4Fe-4S dicluster domain-containing protein [Methanobacterium congolense]|uniref:Putative ferredoxin MJ0155 n=1 Tax=Methanobacterium congolense TaxID=118062 RepID=A0A1D3L3X8_9EURY|nr:4Fe-4S dicluster domain-containing protein [Methanobacterium congolense]SCG86364.1 putative ferredoxin MJ0155 [Methanobacterium congolense]
MKTLMVVDPQMCTECKDCITACQKEHGVARVKKTSTVPIFCLQCHPDKAPCRRICPTNAIKEENGALIIDEDACILCRLCMIACPVGMIVVDQDKKAAQKCTLCMETDNILPACVEACKDNVLKIFSIEDLEDLKKDMSYAEVLKEAMKAYNEKV